MSLEWFHAVLGLVFIGIWLIVGQIIARDRSDVRQSSGDDYVTQGTGRQSTLAQRKIGLTFK
jgi:hypothetical protein